MVTLSALCRNPLQDRHLDLALAAHPPGAQREQEMGRLREELGRLKGEAPSQAGQQGQQEPPAPPGPVPAVGDAALPVDSGMDQDGGLVRGPTPCLQEAAQPGEGQP